MQEKILVGHKLRRFRQSTGLSQTTMSEALDISPSYLNLLEHNQRPLTVALLLKLGNSFDIDMKSFAEDDSPALMTDLAEVFADPLLSGERVSRRELQDLVTAAPSAARGMLSLFQAYRKVRDQLEMNAGDGRGAGGVDNPVERVRDVLQQANNYFPEAETAAVADAIAQHTSLKSLALYPLQKLSVGGAAGAARLRAMCGAATLCDGDAGSPGGAEAGHPLARIRADTCRVRGSRACWNSLARPLRRLISSTGSLCLIRPGAVEPGSDREPYDEASRGNSCIFRLAATARLIARDA